MEDKNFWSFRIQEVAWMILLITESILTTYKIAKMINIIFNIS